MARAESRLLASSWRIRTGVSRGTKAPVSFLVAEPRGSPRSSSNFGASFHRYKQTGHGPNVILTQIAASGCREPGQRQIFCKENLLRHPGRWRNCGMSTVRRIPCLARPITSRRPHHERFSVDVVIAPRPRLVVGELQNIPQAPGSQCKLPLASYCAIPGQAPACGCPSALLYRPLVRSIVLEGRTW